MVWSDLVKIQMLSYWLICLFYTPMIVGFMILRVYPPYKKMVLFEGKTVGHSDFDTRPDFYLLSSRNRADLLSYESKPTDKREQYDFKGEKNLDGYECRGHHSI